ncbi:MAG TPA: hypothetical protein VFI31_21325 [Pirellulales bacterium]|nr:hypothetical protein [Pirellulales bacterium]
MNKHQPHRIAIVAGIACLLGGHCAHAQDGAQIGPTTATELVAKRPKKDLFVASLPLESLAARYARDDGELSLYTVGAPQWTENQPEWLEPQRLVSTAAFDETPHPAMCGPKPQPSSFWERWRQQREERRKRPASWYRYRFYFEKFTSVIRTDEPIHDQIHDGRGNLFGARLGWDFAPQWGVESRLGYLRSTMTDSLHPSPTPHENFLFWDTSALLYLRGDVRFRPFVLCGLGAVDVGFIDDQGVRWNQTLMTMPFGVGFKIRFNDHNAARFEVLDNVVFGNGHGGNSRPMHDVAVGFAYERRFGCPHKTYFPSNDGRRWTRYREWFQSMSH